MVWVLVVAEKLARVVTRRWFGILFGALMRFLKFTLSKPTTTHFPAYAYDDGTSTTKLFARSPRNTRRCDRFGDEEMFSLFGSYFWYVFFKEVNFHRPNSQTTTANMSVCRVCVYGWHFKISFIACGLLQEWQNKIDRLSILSWKSIGLCVNANLP